MNSDSHKQERKRAINVLLFPVGMAVALSASHDGNNHDKKECEGGEHPITHSETKQAFSFQTNTVTTHSFGNNVTDVIAALNCTYMAEGTACEWVVSLTLKKDLCM